MNGTGVAIGLPIPDRMAPAYAYFAAAAALGYDREDGLRFDFVYGGTPLATARALAAEACLFAPLNVIVGFLANECGWPLRAVYGSSRRAHRWFAVPPGSSISSLADFRGKRIACDFADLQPLAESALAEEGIGPGEVTFVPWRGSGMEVRQMLEPLRAGQVDGVFLIDWNHGDFIAEGMPMRRIRSQLLDAAELSSCLWTMPPTVAGAGALVTGVGRALARATLFTLENPAAVIRLMWEHHPDTRPARSERERELRRGVEILRARTGTMRPEGARDPRWGAMRAEEFVAAQDHLLRAGVIRRRHDVNDLFTAAHVDAFNAFDPRAVRDRAAPGSSREPGGFSEWPSTGSRALDKRDAPGQPSTREARGGDWPAEGHSPAAPVLRPPADREAPMILDMHAHVGRPNYAYRADEFSNDDLASRMKSSGVSRCCVFSFYDVADNDYVARACQGRDDLLPFAFINPKEPGAAAELERRFKQGFRGLKLHPFAHGFHLNNFKIVDPLFAHCEHYQVPIICHGFADNVYNTVYAFAEMADRFPRVNLVMAHGGFMWARAEAIRASKTRPNLFIETTCLLPAGIADGIDDIGAEKYIFGSDAPWGDFDVEILKIKKAARKDSDLELILGKNLARLLRLAP